MWPLVDSTNRVVAAEQLGAAVAVLPGRDVVGDAGDDVGVDVDWDRSTGTPSTVSAPGVDELVVHGEVDEVGVQAGGHPGGVGVPEQDVEGRRLACRAGSC